MGVEGSPHFFGRGVLLRVLSEGREGSGPCCRTGLRRRSSGNAAGSGEFFGTRGGGGGPGLRVRGGGCLPAPMGRERATP
jgi:hypothetical protein